jgi:hypothetical protein
MEMEMDIKGLQLDEEKASGTPSHWPLRVFVSYVLLCHFNRCWVSLADELISVPLIHRFAEQPRRFNGAALDTTASSASAAPEHPALTG